MRFRALLSSLVLCAGSTAASAVPYVVDFFPDGQQINNIIQLRFIGPIEGQITQSRLFIDFTTAQGFRAEDLVIQLVAPVIPAEPDGNFWLITGEDLGWNGHGSFSAQVTSDTLNGVLQQG